MNADNTDRKSDEAAWLESHMRTVSRLVSILGLGLMAVGILDYLFSGTTLSIPGFSVLPLSGLFQPAGQPLSVLAMSAGILIFALLPMIRVFLALWTYLGRRVWLSALVALVVLIELLISVRTGG